MSRALNLILIVAFLIVTYGYMERSRQVADLHAAMYMQIREAQAATCKVHEHNIIHEFQCIVKNGKYVVLI